MRKNALHRAFDLLTGRWSVFLEKPVPIEVLDEESGKHLETISILDKIINIKKEFTKGSEIIDCNENVQDEDNANTILRSRKDSSIFKALKYVKENSKCKLLWASPRMVYDLLSAIETDTDIITIQQNLLDKIKLIL